MVENTIGDLLVDTFEGEIFINGKWLEVCQNDVRWKCHDRLQVLANGLPYRLVTHKRKVIDTGGLT